VETSQSKSLKFDLFRLTKGLEDPTRSDVLGMQDYNSISWTLPEELKPH